MIHQAWKTAGNQQSRTKKRLSRKCPPQPRLKITGKGGMKMAIRARAMLPCVDASQDICGDGGWETTYEGHFSRLIFFLAGDLRNRWLGKFF